MSLRTALVILTTSVGVAACQTSQSNGGRIQSISHAPLPRSAVAHSSDPAVAELTVSGTPNSLWNVIIEAFTDSVYHFGGGSPQDGVLDFFSMWAGREIHLAMTPLGNDSTQIRFMGVRYTGRSNRPGVIINRSELWSPITNGDSAAAMIYDAPSILRQAIATHQQEELAEAVERQKLAAQGTIVTTDTVLGGPDEPDNVDTLLRDLPNNRKGFCRANYVRKDRLVIVDVVTMSDWCPLSTRQSKELVGNTYILQDPTDVAIGDTLDICMVSEMPRGFETVEWYADRAHCPFDPSWRWKREPNRVKVRRVE